jgi:hypothetical protein
MWPFKAKREKPKTGEFANVTDEEFERIRDEQCVMFKSEAWRYFMYDMETALTYADTVKDIRTPDEFWIRKGAVQAYERVLAYADITEHTRNEII